ncbi:pentatricopeptide repeat-containing protein, partial [Trifolium medium]|nr:pentatricopeptide repeat-containing protein [Trifolium medium]
MRSLSVPPNRHVFPSLIKASTLLKHPKLAYSLHASTVRLGFDSDLYIANALINMYAKFHNFSVTENAGKVFDVFPQRGKYEIHSVRKVFDMMPVRDVVSWNTVIAGYVQNGMYVEALDMVREMGKNGNLKPDSFTLSSILPIFAEHVDVYRGKEIHGYTVRNGFDGDVFIGSSLVD